MSLNIAASKVIPVPVDNPLFDIQIPLDGINYILRFDYHARQDRWYFGLYTETNARIYVGIKVLSNWPLLRRCADVRRPPGEIMALNQISDEPPGFTDLGRSVVMTYIPRL